MSLQRTPSGVVHIGNPGGRIALYLDENQAHDLAAMFPFPDMGGKELLEAIALAYPRREARLIPAAVVTPCNLEEAHDPHVLSVANVCLGLLAK